jgi:hypothetical protein
MTFCNDATSMARFCLFVVSSWNSSFRSLLHGDGLRNTEESLITAVQEIVLSRWKQFWVHSIKHIHRSGVVQDGLVLSTAAIWTHDASNIGPRVNRR